MSNGSIEIIILLSVISFAWALECLLISPKNYQTPIKLSGFALLAALLVGILIMDGRLKLQECARMEREMFAQCFTGLHGEFANHSDTAD